MEPSTEAAAGVCCEIRVWHGYIKSQFFAVGLDDDGTALATSPLFRRSGDGCAQTEKAMAAHESLVQQLVDAGWVRVGRGVEWYADRFALADADADADE